MVKAEKFSLMGKPRCMFLYHVLFYNTCGAVSFLSIPNPFVLDCLVFCLKAEYIPPGTVEIIQNRQNKYTFHMKHLIKI